MGGSGGGVSWGGVLGIVTLVILGMTAAGFVYWKRTQQQMREQGKQACRHDFHWLSFWSVCFVALRVGFNTCLFFTLARSHLSG